MGAVEVQEVIALAMVAGAAAWLVRRSTGWPRRKASRSAAGPLGQEALLSDRLRQALKTAERDRVDRP